jgi:protoheme IX farnesyltransferase
MTFGGYLFLYTPLKWRTPLCTLAGAFPGAMPVLVGYVAASGRLDSQAWLLYAILFLWQFPHFMAIAWMYREDYARAGYKVLSQEREKTRFMGWQCVLPSLALVSAGLVQLFLKHANPALAAGTLLSLAFLYFTARLAVLQSNVSARRLLFASIVYLPLVFVFQVLARA